MKFSHLDSSKMRSLLLILALLAPILFGNVWRAAAHGGEDHGEQKPKTVAGEKGTVSHTARLGEIEVMIKHQALEPDEASGARLFVTRFATNEPIEKLNAAVEFESANGAVTQATIENAGAAGSYNLKIPALPEGTYTIRARMTYDGETDTATFSGVRVEHSAAEAAAAGGASSWLQTALLFSIGAIVFVLLSGLVYFVWRSADEEQIREKAISV